MAHRIGQYDFSYPTVTNGKALANAHVERIAAPVDPTSPTAVVATRMSSGAGDIGRPQP